MKRAGAVLALAAAALLMSAPAAAQMKSVAVHGHAGYAFPEEGNLRPGLETGFGIAVPFLRRFWLCLEYAHWTGASKTAPGLLYDGTVSVSPAIACVQYEFLDNRFFVPYAFAGGAFVFARFEIGPLITIPETKIDQTIENGPSLYLGLGARLVLSRTVSFFSEVSYLHRTASGKNLVHDMNLGLREEPLVVNLRTVFLRFGFRLFLL
jgi:hypothetical protein